MARQPEARSRHSVHTSTATHTRATITQLADTVIAANENAIYRSVQVVGTTGSILLVRSANTTAGTVGDILNPAAAANQGGGMWDSDTYTGTIALRALGGDVAVSICEETSEL